MLRLPTLRSAWTSAVLPLRRTHAGRPLPFRDALVRALAAQGWPAARAAHLVDTVDAAVLESISREAWRHPTAAAYSSAISNLEARLDARVRDLAAEEAAGAASLSQDAEVLLAEIGRTRERVRDEAQQLAAAVELDIDLERKRREQTQTDEARAAAAEAQQGVRACAEEMQRALVRASNATLLGIGGVASLVMAVFLSLRLFM